MKEIKIYTTPTCGYCHKAKAYLREKGYPFSESDVSKDPQGQSFLRSKGIMGVPVITVGDTLIQGFDPEAIEAAVDFRIQACPHCQKKLRLPKDRGKIRVTCPACQGAFEVRT
jgi:glutaredoxin-like YruB-family protein